VAEAWTRLFYRVWGAAALSNLGDGLLIVALPLAIVRYTRDPLLVSGIAAAAQIPYLVVSLFAGVAADRRDRRKLVIAAAAVAAATLTAMAVTTGTTKTVAVASLYVGAFIVGGCQTAVNTASSSLTPVLVPRSRLDWANSRLYGTESVLNEFVGPPLAGILVTLGIGLAFGAVAAAYAASASALLIGLRGRSFAPRTTATRLRADIAEGIRFVWDNRVLRMLMLIVAVIAGCWTAWEAILVLYVVRPGPVGLSKVGYGALLSTLAVGGVLGALAADHVRRLAGRHVVLLADPCAAAIMIGIPAITANRYAIGAAIFIGGVGSGMWNVAASSLRQALTPDHLRGRTSATGMLLGWGPRPLGALIGGAVAHAFGIPVVFAAGALAILAMFVPAACILTPRAVSLADTAASIDQHQNTAV
jgi:MFS family permease